MTVLILGSVLFTAGVVVTFIGTGLRGRVAGLAGMGGGSLVTLVAARPFFATWMVVALATTALIGMFIVASALARRLAQPPADRASLDEGRG